MKIFVGNLSWDASEEELQQLFSQHGKIVSVRIVKDPYTNRSKGFGFIEYETDADVENAIRALNDTQFMGRPLRVSRARQENGGGGGERRGGGGFRDRGDRGGDRGGQGGGEGRPRRPFRPRYEDSPQYS